MTLFARSEYAKFAWISIAGSAIFGLYGATARAVAPRMVGTDYAPAVMAGLLALAFSATIAYLATLPLARFNVRRWRLEESLGSKPRRAGRRGLGLGAFQGYTASLSGWHFAALAVTNSDPAFYGRWNLLHMTVTIASAAAVGALAYWLAYRTAAGELPAITRKELGFFEKPGPLGRKIELTFIAVVVLGLAVGLVNRFAPLTFVPESALVWLTLWPRASLAAAAGVLAWVFVRVVTSAIGAALPSSGAGALALLKHSLAHSGDKVSQASVTFVFFWFMIGSFFGADALDAAMSAQAKALHYEAIVVPAAGASEQEANAAVDRLADGDRVTVVAVRIVDVASAEDSQSPGIVAIVEPGALDQVVDLGARPFGLSDGVLVMRDSWEGDPWFNANFTAIGSQLVSSTVSGASVQVVGVWPEAPFTMMTPATASELLPESTPAWMVWADGLSESDLRDAVAAAGSGLMVQSDIPPAQQFSVDLAGFVFLVVLSVSLGAGALVASGWQFGKKLQASRALLLALGASPSQLALAAALHGALTSAVAAPAALMAGALWAIVEKLPTALTPGAPVDLDSELAVASWLLGQLPWGWMALSVVASLALGSVLSWLIVRRKAGQPPAVQLREAIKEGAL